MHDFSAKCLTSRFSALSFYKVGWIVKDLFGLAFSFFNYIPLLSILSTNLFSPGVKKSNELPFDLYLAVRPTLWIYVYTSSGQSYYITQSTAGKSIPLEAISVQKSTAFFLSTNSKYIAVRFVYFYLPCNSSNYTPIFSLLNAS